MDGVVTYQDRIVIPAAQRESVIEMLHATHQGVPSMNAQARSSVFWPGIMVQIQDLCDRCRVCHRNAPSNPKPPPNPSSGTNLPI
jgi:hypothetical protein